MVAQAGTQNRLLKPCDSSHFEGRDLHEMGGAAEANL